jgi:predicted transcriptional regulator of viral defense system
MMKILRATIPYEEFDYQTILNTLKKYKKPRDKISQLLKNHEIIRVKKGLYVFGEGWRRHPISVEILGNLIYGPSYISREYALAQYGLIPEHVYTITSMTTGRNKNFNTPLGTFSYEHISVESYTLGVTFFKVDEKRTCLFASVEKALADTIHLAPRIETAYEMKEHLIGNLRIDEDSLRQLDRHKMKEIANHYRSRNVKLLHLSLGSR